MKILVVSPYVPHPRSGHGGGVFMYGMIEHLSRRHDVTLVSFCDESEELLAADLKSLRLECHFLPRPKGKQKTIVRNIALAARRALQFLRSIFRWEPYYVSKFRDGRMERLIEERTARDAFDIVQIEYTQMAGYVSSVRSGRTFLHEHDVSYRPAYRRYRRSKNILLKIFRWMEWCRWASYEPAIARRFDRVLAVTEQDRMLLDWLTDAENARYLPRAMEPVADLPRYESREPFSLLFVGSFSHYPNVDAARWLCGEIFPRVRARYPDAKLYVVGPQPTADLISASAPGSGIAVTGFVGDVDEYFRRCRVFAAPLRFGGGIKIKVLSAMAQGIPVVTTAVGVEGIEGLGPGSVSVAGETPALAESICRLLADPATAAETGVRGWNVIRSRYSWESVTAELEQFYKEALALPGRA